MQNIIGYKFIDYTRDNKEIFGNGFMRLIIGNTYHLAFQPGAEFLKECGGLHKFMNWKYNILTDSGGFQMVSLSKLCQMSENAVTFQSPVDGSEMVLR